MTCVIHLLAYDLDADPREDRLLDRVIDASEQSWAERFGFPELRRRYGVSHTVLQCVLGKLNGITPGSHVFVNGEQDKPALTGRPSLNISHSDGPLMIAVSTTGRLGVDVELHRPVDALEAMARHNFAPDECAAVLATPPVGRKRAFL